MMRALSLVLLLPLAACLPTAEPEISGLTPGDACNAERYGGLVGEPRSAADALAAELAATGQPVRVLAPGDPVTRDFIAPRLNVILGPDGRIQLLRCG